MKSHIPWSNHHVLSLNTQTETWSTALQEPQHPEPSLWTRLTCPSKIGFAEYMWKQRLKTPFSSISYDFCKCYCQESFPQEKMAHSILEAPVFCTCLFKLIPTKTLDQLISMTFCQPRLHFRNMRSFGLASKCISQAQLNACHFHLRYCT